MIKKAHVLALVIVAQLFIPSYMMLQKEIVLMRGAEYRFRTRPVDPYDVMRGRYVALSIDNSVSGCSSGEQIEGGQMVYAVLQKDPEGYASISDVLLRRPSRGDYIKTKVTWK